MTRFLGTVGLLLVMAALAVLATTLVVAGFIGVGALFTRFTELTLFQATIVTTIVGGAALYLLGRIMGFPITASEDEWVEDEWEDWADVEFEELSPEDRRRMIRRLSELLDYLEELDDEDEDVEPSPPRRRRRRR